MHINKFRISADATGRLRALRQRAMLTPNLICRMALSTSLELGPVGPGQEDIEEGQEFNAYTLFGVDEPIYVALLRMIEEDPDAPVGDDVLLQRLRAHIDRGITQLSVRIKSPSDAARLLSGSLS